MDKRILILKGLILANLQSPPTVEEISAELNVSASRLRQLIKEETGMPFGEFVRDLRLERARELLETTFLRVQEIGAAVGIGDQSYFNRVFKEKYGMTPGKYHDEHCVMFKSIEEFNSDAA
jgi:two-component system response regulator YesN